MNFYIDRGFWEEPDLDDNLRAYFAAHDDFERNTEEVNRIAHDKYDKYHEREKARDLRRKELRAEGREDLRDAYEAINRSAERDHNEYKAIKEQAEKERKKIHEVLLAKAKEIKEIEDKEHEERKANFERRFGTKKEEPLLETAPISELPNPVIMPVASVAEEEQRQRMKMIEHHKLLRQRELQGEEENRQRKLRFEQQQRQEEERRRQDEERRRQDEERDRPIRMIEEAKAMKERNRQIALRELQITQAKGRGAIVRIPVADDPNESIVRVSNKTGVATLVNQSRAGALVPRSAQPSAQGPISKRFGQFITALDESDRRERRQMGDVVENLQANRRRNLFLGMMGATSSNQYTEQASHAMLKETVREAGSDEDLDKVSLALVDSDEEPEPLVEPLVDEGYPSTGAIVELQTTTSMVIPIHVPGPGARQELQAEDINERARKRASEYAQAEAMVQAEVQAQANELQRVQAEARAKEEAFAMVLKQAEQLKEASKRAEEQERAKVQAVRARAQMEAAQRAQRAQRRRTGNPMDWDNDEVDDETPALQLEGDQLTSAQPVQRWRTTGKLMDWDSDEGDDETPALQPQGDQLFRLVKFLEVNT